MGKHKRLVERMDLASQRAITLKQECGRYGTESIYELPVSVLIDHRAARLQEMVKISF